MLVTSLTSFCPWTLARGRNPRWNFFLFPGSTPTMLSTTTSSGPTRCPAPWKGCSPTTTRACSSTLLQLGEISREQAVQYNQCRPRRDSQGQATMRDTWTGSSETLQMLDTMGILYLILDHTYVIFS